MIRLFVSLFFLMGVSFACAQELIFEKPTHLNNLPSNETYQIMCDTAGYIWFSSETGLCRYNGQELKIFREKEGIPEEICYGIVQDSKGTIYVITSKNRILKYIGGKFVEIPASVPFSKQMNDMPAYAVAVKVSGDSVLIVTTQGDGFKVNVKNNKVERYISHLTTVDVEIRDFYGILMPLVPYNPRRVVLEKSVFRFKSKKALFGLRFTSGDRSIDYFTKALPKEGGTHRILTAPGTNGSCIIASYIRLIHISKNSTVTETDPKKLILCIYRDKNNGLWVGTRSHGLIYYADADNINGKSICALEGFSVACIREDLEGNIWCTTLENGVLCCRNKNIKRIYENNYEKNKGPFAAKCVGDSVFLFTCNGPVLRFFDDRSDTIGRALSDQYITDIIKMEDKWLVTGKGGTRKYAYDLKKNISLKAKGGTTMSSGNQLLRLKNGRIFSIHYGNLLEVFDTYGNEHRLESEGHKLGIAADSKDSMYVYTSEKLFRVNYADSANITVSEFARFPNIRKIVIDTKDRFWILTKGSTIYISTVGKCDSMFITSPKGQVHCFDIYEDAFSNMWLATNFGILKLSQHKEGYRREWFDQGFGLPNAEFHKITGTSTDIVVSTSTGVYKFPINSREKEYKTKVPVYISSLKVNDVELPAGTKLELDYDQNTIDVKYDILDYSNLSGTERLSYKVIGYDEDLHELDHSDILLTKLPPGEFQLQVTALDEKGNVISAINTLYIKINPPFWQKWPFIIFAIFCSFALIAYIVFLFLRRSRKKIEEKNRIDKMLTEYQMSALKAQMNPHFIFNCINSIQRYILTNKTSDAYDYLAKFSKLIRLVLNYSEDTMITLDEELEIAHLYIEMEQIRYEGFFTYEIICDQNVKKDTVMLPSLLLQPYIENAIWHGIMNLHKSREGQLRVRISMKGEDLKIVIEDNGVGREEAARMRSKNHRSKAIGLNKKRVELINMMNNTVSASILIGDILDTENTVQGTIVKITIPQIHRND